MKEDTKNTNITIEIREEGILDDFKLNNYAIVNAANCSLMGGSGVALALQEAGGKDLVEKLTKLGKEGGCNVTQNVVTEPYDLKNKGITHIIHAVGPDFREAKNGFTKYGKNKGVDFKLQTYQNEDSLLDVAQETLTQTYLHLFETAIKQGITTIACPVISGGVFRGKNFSEDNMAYMTIHAIQNATKQIDNGNLTVVLCAFDNEKSKEHYFKPLQKYNDNISKVSNFSSKINEKFSKEKGCILF